MTNIYQFEAELLDGKNKSFADYEGEVLLIVNTASKCGFTPQFAGLEKIYEQYHAQGFEVLGFPCNQFGGQDPGSNEQIGTYCQKNYGVTFPMFSKVDVKGPEAHELGCSGYKIETIALKFHKKYNAFRITCIMLILEKFNNQVK